MCDYPNKKNDLTVCLLLKKSVLICILLFILSFLFPALAHSQAARKAIEKTAQSLLESGITFKEQLQDTIKPSQKEPIISSDTQKALSDITLYTTLAEIRSPIPPFSYGPYHVFIHYDTLSDSRVQIAFEHENYFSLHPFIRLSSNKNVLVYITTHNTQNIFKYRLVVDGIWTYDAQNDQSSLDSHGIRVSVTRAKPYSSILSPSVVYNSRLNTLRFSFLFDDTIQIIENTALKTIDLAQIKYQAIYLVGNFTAWDPFFLQMKQSPENPALYYVDVEANVGVYYYYFQVGNYSTLDPKNREIHPRRDGQTYTNAFVLTKTTSPLTGASIKLVQMSQ